MSKLTMDVWWGGLLPAPEDYGKDPRIEQLADLKRQLEAANKMVASLTPKAVDKGTRRRRRPSATRRHVTRQ